MRKWRGGGKGREQGIEKLLTRCDELGWNWTAQLGFFTQNALKFPKNALKRLKNGRKLHQKACFSGVCVYC
jgi:hypothetical protein